MKQSCKNLLLFILLLVALPRDTFSQVFTVDTILYQGEVDYPINLVILGDGFLESELQDFRDQSALYCGPISKIQEFL